MALSANRFHCIQCLLATHSLCISIVLMYLSFVVFLLPFLPLLRWIFVFGWFIYSIQIYPPNERRNERKKDMFIASAGTFTKGTLVPVRCSCMSYPFYVLFVFVRALTLTVQHTQTALVEKFHSVVCMAVCYVLCMHKNWLPIQYM